MTTETEKLEKRCTKLTEWVEGAALPPSWEEVFSVTQAARRYAEVLPLLEAFDEYADRMITYREEDIARLDDADRDTFFHAARHEAVILTLEEVAALLKRDKIAAIVARGE